MSIADDKLIEAAKNGKPITFDYDHPSVARKAFRGMFTGLYTIRMVFCNGSDGHEVDFLKPMGVSDIGRVREYLDALDRLPLEIEGFHAEIRVGAVDLSDRFGEQFTPYSFSVSDGQFSFGLDLSYIRNEKERKYSAGIKIPRSKLRDAVLKPTAFSGWR